MENLSTSYRRCIEDFRGFIVFEVWWRFHLCVRCYRLWLRIGVNRGFIEDLSRGFIEDLSRMSRRCLEDVSRIYRGCIEDLLRICYTRLFEAWCRFHQCVRCYRLTPKDRRLPRMNRGVIDEDLWTSYRRCIEDFRGFIEDLSRGFIKELSRMYRRCLEDDSKMSRRCLEDVSKMSRGFIEDLLLEAIRALMEVSSMCPMSSTFV